MVRSNSDANPAYVRCVVLPTTDTPLLLPYASVAEIIAHDFQGKVPTPSARMPSIDWRGQRVPLTCFEAGCAMPLPEMRNRERLAVLYNTEVSMGLPYLALLLQGAPRSLEVTEDELVVKEEREECAFVLARAEREGELYLIPDLPAMASFLSSPMAKD